MKHFPASHAPALAGIQDCLTQSAGTHVATLTLRRSTALLTLAVVAAFFFFLGAYVFGRALVAQHSEPTAYSLQPTASQP